jgi:hypothetical protein
MIVIPFMSEQEVVSPGAAQAVSCTDEQTARQDAVTDGLVAVIDKLQQRELLEPLWLLSAGYVALPFFLKQLLLLLAPMLAVIGFSMERQGESSA